MKIVRILPVPVYESGEKIEVSIKEEEEVRAKWQKLLCYLRKYLVTCKNIAFKNKLIGEGDGRDLYTLLDLIVLFFKAPLFKEPLKNIYASPFKKLVLFKLLYPIIYDDVFHFVNPDTSNEHVISKMQEIPGLSNVFNDIIDNEELQDILLYAYNFIPSDTRPGFNYSSLIVHLLVSSAIAWCKAIQDLDDDNIAAKVSLATLLHDIGKPLNYKSHVTESVRVVRYLFDGILSKTILDEIIKMVSQHHDREPGKYACYVSNADKLSAGYDRLLEIVKENIYNKLDDILRKEGIEGNAEITYQSGREAWRIWDELSSKNFEYIVELSKNFRHIIRRNKSKGSSDFKGSNIYLVKGDVRGIQEYVKGAGLIPGIMYSSMLIDYLVITHIPIFFEKRKIPFAAFLYNGGGNFLLMLPEKKLQDAKEALEEAYTSVERKNDVKTINYPKITLAYIPLPEEKQKVTPGDLFTILEQRLSFMKNILDTNEKVSSLLGIEYRCELCGNKPAQEKDHELRICSDCFIKVKKGREISFCSRWQSFTYNGVTLSKITGLDYSEISEKVIEFLSGVDVEKIVSEEDYHREVTKLPNIAVLKVDGNLMGAYMATSITFSDLVERSIRIDLALKEAWRNYLDVMSKSLPSGGTFEALRASLGLIYMGGDDALLILPAWQAIPASIALALGFYNGMGGDRSLSIGIASAPPKHPLYVLIDAAERILDDNAKNVGRNSEKGAISFIYIENGTLTGSSALRLLKNRKELCVSLQPLVFETGENSIFKLLSILFDIEYSDDLGLNGYLSKLIGLCYSEIERIKSRSQEKSIAEKVYKVSREMLERYILRQSSGNHVENVALIESIIYLIRQAHRETDYQEAYKAFIHKGGFYYKNRKIISSFFDIAQLYKFISGGF